MNSLSENMEFNLDCSVCEADLEEKFDDATGDYEWFQKSTRNVLLGQVILLIKEGLSVDTAVKVVVSCWAATRGEYGD